jgi:hypothetical protein
MGRLMPDGCLEHLGRKDFQVKIRGNRVEVTEIEAALREQDTVKEAVVVARTDVAGEQRLIAYVIPAEGRTPTIADLRRVLGERFPPYMVPSFWVQLDKLPLTPTGKVDRQALPPPTKVQRDPGTEYVQAMDPLQYGLVLIWEGLLKTKPVGVRDDFFVLGGDSLIAGRMLAQIEQTYGRRLPLATLATRSTIESLAVAIKDQKDQPPTHLVQVQAGTWRKPFFLLHGDLNGGGLYCVPLARHLGPDQPLYGLAPHGAFGDDIPATIEEMASDHLQRVCAVHPEGPYLLGGHCNGSLVAFEMARRLAVSGKQVDLLVMVEPPPTRWLVEAATFVSPLPIPDLDRSELNDAPSDVRLTGLFAIYRKVISRFRPKFFPGRIIIFTSSPVLKRASEPSLGWKAVAGRGVEVHVLPGSFHAAISSHFEYFAEELKGSLLPVSAANAPGRR